MDNQKLNKDFVSKRISRLAASQILPYYDGKTVGFDYYLQDNFFVRFLHVHERGNENMKFPLLDALGLPAQASYAEYEERVLQTTNRQRIKESFRKAGGSVCLNLEQRERFESLLADGRYAAEIVEVHAVKPNSGTSLKISPVDLEDDPYERWLDFVQEQEIGFYISYQDELEVFKETRLEFERKIGELEMDEHFLNRRMKIRLFKRQFQMDVPIPRQHVWKKIIVTSTVTIASLVIAGVGHSMLYKAGATLGMKVAGATMKALGAFGAIAGRTGYWTLVRDFEDRPIILQDGDSML